MPKGTEITAYINGEIKIGSSPMPAEPVAIAKINTSPKNVDPPKRVDSVAPNKGIIVRFTSAPGSAEVNVDGSYWGTTPTSDLTRLPAGAHTIVVKKIGYKPWERKIDLQSGDDRTVNAELEVDNAKARISGLN